MLEGKDLTLTLTSRRILHGVSLTLCPGRITAILGPNGAGKTSLLRLLSGEWKADSGSVELEGTALASLNTGELGRRRAYLHQESSLDFAFTVLEVVLLGRSPHMEGGERPIDYEMARQALHEVDLAERSEDFYTALSGGEKQRVHLARILAQIRGEGGQPRYLFLDEPTNNLDLSHQRTVFRLSRSLAREGVAICVVLHDVNQALQLADEVVVLKDGRMALAGAPGEIATRGEWEEIFDVSLRRVEIPGRRCPYLVFEDVPVSAG